jgi:hypothetical protein
VTAEAITRIGGGRRGSSKAFAHIQVNFDDVQHAVRRPATPTDAHRRERSARRRRSSLASGKRLQNVQLLGREGPTAMP